MISQEDVSFIIGLFISLYVLYVIFIALKFVAKKIMGYIGSFFSERTRNITRGTFLFILASCFSTVILMILIGKDEVPGSGALSIIFIILSLFIG